MATREIQREEWSQFFNNFSKQHENNLASVSEFSEEIGAQEVLHDAVFGGISADEKDGENDIVLMLGIEKDNHVERIINSPSKVWLREAESPSSSEWIDIERADGMKVVMEVHPVPELAAV